MIAPPYNDTTCLTQITDFVGQLVQENDPAILALAAQVGTIEGLIDYIRGLPQRDDDGDPTDGPRARACRPSQRVRLVPIPDNPNCVERTALFIAVASKLRPNAVYQMRTERLPEGLHTFPMMNGSPVILNPNTSRNAVAGAVFQSRPRAHPLSLDEAINLIAYMAEEPGEAIPGAGDRIEAGHAAMRALHAGQPLDERAIDDLAYTCILALQESPKFGAKGRAVLTEMLRAISARMPRPAPVPTTAANDGDDGDDDDDHNDDDAQVDNDHQVDGHQADAELRNVSVQIGPYKISPNWDALGAVGRVAGRIGLDVGSKVLQAKLGVWGLTPMAMSALEHELNREGVSLGRLAPRAPSIASLALMPTVDKILARKPPAAKAAAVAVTATQRATNAAAGTLTVQKTAVEATRNLRNALVATPGQIETELDQTDGDIKALERDIVDQFRRPWEEKFKAANARFEKEMGRIAGAGVPSKGPGNPGKGLSIDTYCGKPDPKFPDIPTCGKHRIIELKLGVNDYVSSDKDWARVYSYMDPVPNPVEILWKSYNGGFVHNFHEFFQEWQAFYDRNKGYTARMWGGLHEQALDYRKKVQTWRDQFIALGGKPTSPAPQVPDRPGLFDAIGKTGSTVRTVALAAGGVATAALLLRALR